MKIPLKLNGVPTGSAIETKLSDTELITAGESVKQIPMDYSGEIVSSGLDAIRYYADKDSKEFSHLVSLGVTTKDGKGLIQSRYLNPEMQEVIKSLAGKPLSEYKKQFKGKFSCKPVDSGFILTALNVDSAMTDAEIDAKIQELEDKVSNATSPAAKTRAQKQLDDFMATI